MWPPRRLARLIPLYGPPLTAGALALDRVPLVASITALGILPNRSVISVADDSSFPLEVVSKAAALLSPCGEQFPTNWNEL